MENPSICGENKCENSYGTYTCLQPSTTTTTTTTTTEPPITVEDEVEEEIDSEESASRESDDDEKNEKSEKEEMEINKISVEETTTFESESKVHSEEEDDIEDDGNEEEGGEREDLENSIEDTRAEIESDNEIPKAILTSTEATSTVIGSTTEEAHEDIIQKPVEEENGIETENEDNDDGSGRDIGTEDEVEEQMTTIQMHHQSSTVKSDLQNECDDGLRYDDTTEKCVGEWN